MRHYLPLLLGLLLLPAAQAFDVADVGTYAVLHKDKTESKIRFHVSQPAEGQWKLEQKKDDGSWEDISCEKDCALQEAVEADLPKFFPARTLAQIVPSCLYNDAFAFCSYRLRDKPDEEKRYLMVALVTGTPTPIYIKRVGPTRE